MDNETDLKEEKLSEINTDKIKNEDNLIKNEDILKIENNLDFDGDELIHFPDNLPDFEELERKNEERRKKDEENQEIINNLVKQGKYDEVLQFLNIKEKEEDNESEPLEIIPADNISDLHEEKEDNENINMENKENDIKNEDINNDNKKKIEEEIKENNNMKLKENNSKKEEENKEIKEENKKEEIKEENKKEEIKEENKNEEIKGENKKEEEKEKEKLQKIEKIEEIKKDSVEKNIKKELTSKNNISKISKSESNSISDLLLDKDEENNYEDLLENMNILEKIEKENKENENIKVNLEILTKELEELENHEDEDKNNIEQMNELYLMLQEDKNSKSLQIETREKLFPYYNDTNYNLSDVLKSDLFKNLSLMRNCFISSNIIKLKPINFGLYDKKFEINYPKSSFDNLEYSSKDLKSEMDYESYLMEYKNSNSVNLKVKGMKDLFNKFKKEKSENKIIQKKNIEINLDNNENENNDFDDIQETINNWIKINNDNDNDNENEVSIKLNEFNKVFLDCFNKNNIDSRDKIKNILELNLSKQNLKSFPTEKLKNLPKLTFLNLEENQIEKICDLSYCEDLYSINLNRNMIKKIEGISNLKSLEKLSLNNNLIEKIEGCENNKRLRFLFLGKNKIRNIDSIENQVLFIEELILCENEIQSIPEKFSLPYLRFLDLNENNIKNISNFYFCPLLEKLLLKGNNIDSSNNNNNVIFSYLPKLREIDLSFNKINNLSFVLNILRDNLNLEIINIGNNPFVTICDKFLIKVLLSIFPKLKIINNDDYTQSIYKKKTNKRNTKKLFYSESYFYIIQLQNFFMKYFNSVYFTNQILNQFNININSNLTEENIPLLNSINTNFFNFKKFHLKNLNNCLNGKFCFFNKHVSLQTNLLLYLYDFKYKMLYIYNSMGIFSKNLTLRKIKIVKIQQLYKLRIIRKKLAAIVIPDDEYDHADDLLDFFNSKPKEEETVDFKWEKGKIEQIENQIKLRTSQEIKNNNNQSNKEININNNTNKNNNNTFLTQKKNVVYKLSTQGLETIKEKEKENENENLNNQKSNNLIEKEETIKNNQSNEEILKLMKNLNTNMKTNKLTPMKITPTPSNHKIYLKSSIDAPLKVMNNNINNNNLTSNLSNIENPSLSQLNDITMTKTRYPNLQNYNKGENIPLKYININTQMGIIPGIKSKGNFPQKNYLPPIKRPDSKNTNNNNFNISTSNISDETRSVKSTFTFNSKFKNIKGRVLPQKVADEIRRLEQECNETIQKAKAEWGFTNPQTAELLAKKIYKKYRKKISHLLQ